MGESLNEGRQSDSDGDDWFDQLVQDNVEEIPATQPDPEDLPAIDDIVPPSYIATPPGERVESQWRVCFENSPKDRPVARPLHKEFAVADGDSSTNGTSGASIPPNPSPKTPGVLQDKASSSKADRIAILKAKLQELEGLIEKTESGPLYFSIFQFFQNSGYIWCLLFFLAYTCDDISTFEIGGLYGLMALS